MTPFKSLSPKSAGAAATLLLAGATAMLSMIVFFFLISFHWDCRATEGPSQQICTTRWGGGVGEPILGIVFLAGAVAAWLGIMGLLRSNHFDPKGP
jgi:hypothetical protein